MSVDQQHTCVAVTHTCTACIAVPGLSEALFASIYGVLVEFICGHVVVQDRREYVRLQSVPFAEEGPWTLNFWFRSEGTNNVTGLSYILSTVGTSGAVSPVDENQVRPNVFRHF